MPISRHPQSVLFPVDEWTKKTAKSWLEFSGLSWGPLRKKGEHYRAELFSADRCVEGSFWTERWKSKKDARFRMRKKPKNFLAVFCRLRRR